MGASPITIDNTDLPPAAIEAIRQESRAAAKAETVAEIYKRLTGPILQAVATGADPSHHALLASLALEMLLGTPPAPPHPATPVSDPPAEESLEEPPRRVRRISDDEATENPAAFLLRLSRVPALLDKEFDDSSAESIMAAMPDAVSAEMDFDPDALAWLDLPEFQGPPNRWKRTLAIWNAIPEDVRGMFWPDADGWTTAESLSACCRRLERR